jgi:His/Glu/Gln/Arg/opine family amino acid ABC transporter permease subunit
MDLATRVAATLPLLLDGLWTTIIICAAGMVLAVATAVPIVLARRARRRWVGAIAVGWVGLIRGLPIVILVFLLYFGLPALLDLGRVSAFWVGVVALGLNGGAFVSEILRAAIARIPAGQWEAASALGLSRPAVWRRVVIPQMLPLALPALVGEATFIVKASPVLSLITVVDLTRRSQQVAMQTFDPLAPMLAAALLYFIVLFALSRLAAKLEARLAPQGLPA